jgi:hypothetical protein
VKLELRAMTNSQRMRLSAVMISSEEIFLVSRARA